MFLDAIGTHPGCDPRVICEEQNARTWEDARQFLRPEVSVGMGPRGVSKVRRASWVQAVDEDDAMSISDAKKHYTLGLVLDGIGVLCGIRAANDLQKIGIRHYIPN